TTVGTSRNRGTPPPGTPCASSDTAPKASGPEGSLPLGGGGCLCQATQSRTHHARVGGLPVRGQGSPQEPPVTSRGQSGIQHRDHPTVLGGSQQTARSLGQEQGRVRGGHREKTVTTVRVDRASAGRGQGIVRPREGDTVHHHQRQRRP